jgi:hypothetical protein
MNKNSASIISDLVFYMIKKVLAAGPTVAGSAPAEEVDFYG